MARYRLKPDPYRDTDLHVAKYEPGKPLDDLLAVARRADARAEAAEAQLPSGAVLVVRFMRYPDDEGPDWAVIEPGAYLVYSAPDGNLLDTDEEELQTFYDRLAGE